MPLASPYRPEPAFIHGQGEKTAVILCNLGTPDAPTAPAVRRYLAQFLSDPRVVEIPRLLWLPILHGIILRVRPAKSAAKYASIWTDQGSPLKVWTQKQANALGSALQERGHEATVRYAMRYGNPSIESVLDEVKAQGATRILVVPAYPQYSGTTTASIVDAVNAWTGSLRSIPELRFVARYHDDHGYIAALAHRVAQHRQDHGQGRHLVMSFHGVPARTLALGDPYHCECLKTARLLARELGLGKDQYTVTFQSRFGKAKWLEPYTEPTLVALAQRGVHEVDVVCPGFTSDCLETLEEISLEARDAFMAAGGKAFRYIPCLNDDAAWMDALASLAEKHLAGWPTREPADADALARSRAEALLRGAPQ